MSTCLPAFVLVTGNRNKLAEARRIMGGHPGGDRLEMVEVDLPEIQSLDLGEVLAAKGGEAWARLARPLVVEETGLELSALGGFPGPLVKWMLQAAGAEGIARCALALEDPGATARCRLLYRDHEREITAEGVDRGRLVAPPRGRTGFGWDPVFQPDGSSETYAEMAAESKDARSHRGRAWRDLLKRLEGVEASPRGGP